MIEIVLFFAQYFYWYVAFLLTRAKNSDYKAGETWYIISGKWWNAWKEYTHYDVSIFRKILFVLIF